MSKSSFWALFGSAEHRRELLKDGWKHFGKIFILAIILDLVYQLKVQQPVNVAGVIVAALVLAVLPYVALRGPIDEVRSFADGITAQRGVRHGHLWLVPAEVVVEHHSHGPHEPAELPHIHTRPRS